MRRYSSRRASTEAIVTKNVEENEATVIKPRNCTSNFKLKNPTNTFDRNLAVAVADVMIFQSLVELNYFQTLLHVRGVEYVASNPKSVLRHRLLRTECKYVAIR